MTQLEAEAEATWQRIVRLTYGSGLTRERRQRINRVSRRAFRRMMRRVNAAHEAGV
jgi:hypothetical protein